MKKLLIYIPLLLLFACQQSTDGDNGDASKTEEEKTSDIEQTKSGDIDSSKGNEDHIDMKSLFRLSPLSIFDETTEGLALSEKTDLLQKGESATWKITDESRTKLTIQCKHPSSEVTLFFFKHRVNLDGVLFARIMNEQNSKVHSWRYIDDSKTLQKADVLKKYSANEFVSEEDRLPDSYTPVLNYQFLDDQTIEVSLQTWMDKEFENREIINRILLQWNGEDFEEKIVKNQPLQESGKLSLLNKSNYDLKKLDHDGKIVNQRIWNDANGENIVLFTQKEEELFVYHYAIDANNPKLLRKIYDAEKDCDYDLTLEFVGEAIKLTDLDNDNIGEITFAYKIACISDVSPVDLKLVLLEDGKKFIVRGRTVVNMGDNKLGGDKSVDASFKSGPDNFLSHANKIWDSINQ